jgi:tol-pal system protein YbgF
VTPERSAAYEDEPERSPDAPTPIFGTLTPPGAPPAGISPAGRPEPPRSNPQASAAATQPVGAPPASANGVLPGGSATEQYNYAFGLMKQANYPAAEAAFKEFIAAHPKDQVAGNAQYWLGETFYARGKYMEAASAFAEGYKRYPKSSKAPDALLKLGMSLARADQKQNACVALAKLGDEFPQAASSVKQRAASEMKKLGC